MGKVRIRWEKYEDRKRRTYMADDRISRELANCGLTEKCPNFVNILRHIEQSLYIKDREGNFLLVNEAKARHSGVLWQQMIGMTDFDFLSKTEAQKSRTDDLRVMETGQPIINEREEITRPDGKKVWILFSKYANRDSVTGEIIGIIGISSDITERKLTEDRLTEAHKYIARMLSIVAHDIRGPLEAISMGLGRLEDGRTGSVDEKAKGFISVFRKKITQIMHVGKSCLAGMSAVLSDGIIKVEEFDLYTDIIKPLLEELNEERNSKEIKLDNSLGAIPGGKIMISANKTWVEVVYRNLFSNAIKYTPKGGTIAFGFCEPELKNEWRLNVFSTSVIPTEKQGLLFKILESENSSGLGLSNCEYLVKRHGGQIWFEVTGEGYSNFIFTLPKREDNGEE